MIECKFALLRFITYRTMLCRGRRVTMTSRPVRARIRAGRRHSAEREKTAVLAIFLTICAAYLVVPAGFVLICLPSWRRARRAVPFGKHHWEDVHHAAGTAAPGARGAR